LADIIAITMPCFGTTARTKGNAHLLCEALEKEAKIECREMDISESVMLTANAMVFWRSLNEDVATVDANGNITVVGGGKAAIIAETLGGDSGAVVIITANVNSELQFPSVTRPYVPQPPPMPEQVRRERLVSEANMEQNDNTTQNVEDSDNRNLVIIITVIGSGSVIIAVVVFILVKKQGGKR